MDIKPINVQEISNDSESVKITWEGIFVLQAPSYIYIYIYILLLFIHLIFLLRWPSF